MSTQSTFAEFEVLESRTLLSWPAAPFHGRDMEDTLYVNQRGTAVVSGKRLGGGPTSDFDGYAFFFDDSGTVTIRTTGSTPTQLAFYGRSGKPTRIDRGSAGNGQSQLTVEIPPDKRMLYVAVTAQHRGQTGSYGLVIHGPTATAVHNINSGDTHTDITGEGDIDFFKYQAPSAGTYRIRVKPKDSSLDPSMNIFDTVTGKPLAGSYTQPVNHRGAGLFETAFVHLDAGQRIYIRVDGVGDGTGDFGVVVRRV